MEQQREGAQRTGGAQRTRGAQLTGGAQRTGGAQQTGGAALAAELAGGTPGKWTSFSPAGPAGGVLSGDAGVQLPAPLDHQHV